jgi:SAM-dependent methyltransferase
MQESYAAQYRELYYKHWWWRAREAMFIDILDRLYSTRKDLSILDVGCGDGLFFPALKRYGTPRGVEPVEEIVTELGRAEGDIYVGYFDDTYPTPAPIDLIVMADVIEHIPDDLPILQRAKRALAQDGTLLVSVPALECLWTHHDDLNLHERRYSKSSLKASLERAGFEVVSIRYAFIWPGFAKLILHFLEKLTSPKNKETHIPARPINAFLTALTRAEWLATRALPVPFGSSLIAVARPK